MRICAGKPNHASHESFLRYNSVFLLHPAPMMAYLLTRLQIPITTERRGRNYSLKLIPRYTASAWNESFRL
jgi:hypothetical protein